MPKMLPDHVILCLYSEIIVPWETGLRETSGCWDIKRTRLELQNTSIHIEIAEAGQVSEVAKAIRRKRIKNFVVFVGADSQAKDLFRHLRNCAAHASFRLKSPRQATPTLLFQGLGYRNAHSVIEGQLEISHLAPLVRSLVTY